MLKKVVGNPSLIVPVETIEVNEELTYKEIPVSIIYRQSSLLERIKAHQFDDPHLFLLRDTVQLGGAKKIVIGDFGVMQLQGRICVPNVDGLIELILQKAHSLRYSIHPGVTKMYRDLKQHYWWRRMKKNIVAYVSQCLNCQ
ncbi:uncharacterized protein [Nicotiana tomentosiformis]|uniref:uncharacterized protein n=1 Tax=Nicotiana tomentosiformis TaxID=4098 RepID=UPI00388C340F